VKKALKYLLFLFGVCLFCVIIGFGIYVYLYYPRTAQTYEYAGPDPGKKILIASQGSSFKEKLVQTIFDSLKYSSGHIKVIDVGRLEETDAAYWDKILIVNTFMVRLNSDVNEFIQKISEPDKVLIFITSGGADWRPEPKLKIDALTSASRIEEIDDLRRAIIEWIDKESEPGMELNNHVLALKFNPRVDVRSACRAIFNDQQRYRQQYPDLERMINHIGYQYIRLQEINAAVEIFRLNVKLFPESWNVYDSYGEALYKKGQRKAAINSYRKALQINPYSKSSRSMLNKLESQ